MSMEASSLGVGSLLVQEPVAGEKVDANMFVPVDLLLPILDDLCSKGRVARSSRPWLGLCTGAGRSARRWLDRARRSGGARAGVQLGDRVIEVAGQKVGGLRDLFPQGLAARPGRHGSPAHACTRVATLARAAHSTDRDALLKKPQRH